MNKNVDKEKKVLKILEDTIFTLGITLVALNIINGAMNIVLHIKAHNQHDDSETASVKEGNILKTEIVTKKSKASLKNVVIDKNNNGIEDADDVVIDGKLFTFSEAKEGRNVVFLQSKKRLKPLAVENENGKLNVKKSPSDIYNLTDPERDESVKKLDNEFNNMIAQKSR